MFVTITINFYFYSLVTVHQSVIRRSDIRKPLIISFLCAVWTMTVFDIGSAQNRRQRMQADWSFWKGADSGSVIGDFERITYEDIVSSFQTNGEKSSFSRWEPVLDRPA